MFKRIIAIVLVAMLALSFAGCHKKGEIAIKVNGLEFTSAYYMCALVNADSTAKSMAQESLTDDEKSGKTEIDYFSKKIEDKSFVEWVEDTALENIKTIAAYKLICKENDLKLDEETLKNAQAYADYYWSGYGPYFEINGVGKQTYIDYMVDTYYSELYFQHIYGPEGEKAIKDDQIKQKVYDNFVIANILTGNYTTDMDESKKASLKTEFENYKEDLLSGAMTFKEVYNLFNGIKEEENAEENTETTDSADEQSKPLDEYASVIGAEGTSYEAAYYSSVKALALGEIKVIELEDKSGIVLAVKQDITADPYYLEMLDPDARHLIADEDFEKNMDEYKKDIELEINKYAVGQFKVKKIKEPEYN